MGRRCERSFERSQDTAGDEVVARSASHGVQPVEHCRLEGLSVTCSLVLDLDGRLAPRRASGDETLRQLDEHGLGPFDANRRHQVVAKAGVHSTSPRKLV